MPYFPATTRYALPYRAVEMRQQRLKVHQVGARSAQAAAVPGAAAHPDDFGAQGGDPSRGVDIDLSTCVNRYGPAPAAIAALHAIEPADLVLHPYEAAERLTELYRWATGVQRGVMVAGRGASEFIWAMGRELEHGQVHVPLPGYTDYLKAFPGRGFSVAGEQAPTLEQLDAALWAAEDAEGVVIISNPHNPTGTCLDAHGLVELAAAHPAATLVVDESYVGFTPDPIGRSVLGCDVPNIVVLRSTSKFYGIAAMRAGIAWCAEAGPLKRLFGRQETWGLSGVDVRAAEAAVHDFHWSSHSRAWMHADNAWLARELSVLPSVQPMPSTDLHFQYVLCEHPHQIAAVFARHGIGIRVLGHAHGVRPGGLRIVAPRVDERDRFSAALAEAATDSPSGNN